MKTITILSFIFLASSSLFSQEAFERIYSMDGRTMRGTDIAQTSDGSYLLLSSVSPDSPDDSTQVNVTKITPKGDVDWSKDYQFDANASFTVGELVLLERDSFIFTLSHNQATINNIWCKASPSGDLLWSNAYGSSLPNTDPSFSPVIPLVYSEKDYILVGNTDRTVNEPFPFPYSDIFLAFIDTFGVLQQSLVFDTETEFQSLQVSGADTTFNKGIIITGKEGNNLFLTKLDATGMPEWNRTYNDNEPSLGNIYVNHVISTPDTGYLITGYRLNEVINMPSRSHGLVIKLDSLGLVQWTVDLALEASLQMNFYLGDVKATSDGGYIITGDGGSSAQQTGLISVFKLDALGHLEWSNLHLEIGSLIAADFSSVILTADGGYALYGNASIENDSPPYFVKLDETGSSSCEDTISLIVNSIDIVIDTFSMLITSADTTIQKEIHIEDFNDFTVPILSLESPEAFCEGEPIEWTFDATIPGAVSYDWSTGETTDSITVTEEGMYIVDVRIEENGCYNLCDTATISTMGPPMAQISDLGDFCLNSFTTLGVGVDSAIDSLRWSTGDTTPMIEVSESGTYSVMVFNRCGIGESSIEVQEIAPQVSINSTGNICIDGVATLSLSTQGGAVDSISWSTGAMEQSLQITEFGTYSVEVFNQCGSDMATIEIPEILPIVDLNVSDSLCFGGETLLSFTAANANPNNFTWFLDNIILENETSDTLMATTEGIYKIVVANNCGTDEKEFELECTFEDCIQVPNVFTPNSDQVNDDFSAIIMSKCANVITIREMRIYNRWGQLVFETTTGQAWDGQYDNKLAPSDVYIYYIETFNASPEEGDGIEVFKGDVTLVR